MPIRVAFLGAPGTGKSSLIKKLCQSFIQNGVRLYVLDNSMEMFDYYRVNSPPGTPVRCISLHHADSVGLNFGKMVANPLDRRLFAKLITSNTDDNNTASDHPFFAKMSEIVTYNVCKVLHKLMGDKLLLADIVRVATFPQLHSKLCEITKIRDPYLQFGENNSKVDTQVTLTSHFEPLAMYAAMDMRATERIDYPFMPEPGVFVYEWSYRSSAAISSIISFLIEYKIAHYLSRQSDEQAMFIGDELRLIKKVEGLVPLAGAGRKSGLGFVLSLHSVNGLIKMFGRELALEILGLCDWRVVLRSACPETSEWASKILGEGEVRQDLLSNDANWSATIKNFVNVMASEIRHVLKNASWQRDRVEGYMDGPNTLCKFATNFRSAVTMPKELPPRPLLKDSDLELPELTELDMVRFGVAHDSEVRDIVNGVKKEKRLPTPRKKNGEAGGPTRGRT